MSFPKNLIFSYALVLFLVLFLLIRRIYIKIKRKKKERDKSAKEAAFHAALKETKSMLVADELLKLKKLMDYGLISRSEFEERKKRLL